MHVFYHTIQEAVFDVPDLPPSFGDVLTVSIVVHTQVVSCVFHHRMWQYGSEKVEDEEEMETKVPGFCHKWLRQTFEQVATMPLFGTIPGVFRYGYEAKFVPFQPLKFMQ